MIDLSSWGVVSTIKAPLTDILNFAAYHLELGAHRIYIYLDDENEDAFNVLKQHPKIRVFKADTENWRTKKRPLKHQVRQTDNARHAYNRRIEVAWLAHIDVDEFIWPDRPINEQLAALSKDTICARIRPIESLAATENTTPSITHFKSCATNRVVRQQETDAIYPTYGAHLNGGFLSHVVGKMFYRTGVDGLAIRIHNVFIGDEKNPGQTEFSDMRLCHMHAQTWDEWMQTYRFRLEKGSYRAELATNQTRDNGGMTMHELFKFIEESQGLEGLRHFYNEVCLATPALRERLSHHGRLMSHSLDLDNKRARHFPDFA